LKKKQLVGEIGQTTLKGATQQCARNTYFTWGIIML